MTAQFQVKGLVLSISLVFSNLLLVGQNTPYNEVSIASPNAASLGKYIDLPVNYSTGIPQVGIPIYTVKEGTLELPISLSYHAGGLKVMEPASWVGTGWSLIAGGMISRTVNGIPDEIYTGSAAAVNNGKGTHFTNYGFNNYLMLTNEVNKATLVDFEAGRADGEPDMFNFSFGPYSGKFIFSDDRTPVLFPEQDLKIEYTYTPGFNKSIDAFKITTPDGTQYHFGRTASTSDIDPVERTNPMSSQNGMNTTAATSTWFLNRISSPDSYHNINLNYAQENYAYPTIAMVSFTSGDADKTGYSVIKNFVEGVALSSITWSEGSITFTRNSNREDLSGAVLAEINDETNTTAKSLQAIEIKSTSNSFCKKILFYQNYFYDGNTPLKGGMSFHNISSDRKRLRLDSIREISCTSGIELPAHKFEYFSEFVPRRLSFGQDHWGFINGQHINNNTIVPAYTKNNFEVVTGANREPSWPAMRAGSLKKIVYPTGGFHELEFEPHTTWISTPRFNSQNIVSSSFGFDGNPNYSGTSITITNNTFRLYGSISSSNPTISGSGTISIKNSSNQVVAFVTVNNTTRNKELYFSAPPGTYSVTGYLMDRGLGEGVSFTISEQVPFTYQGNEIVGGLRVKSTKVSSESSPDIITNYEYSANSVSSGILYSRPTYVQIIQNDTMLYTPVVSGGSVINYERNPCSYNGCRSCDMGGIYEYFISPSPIRPMETINGMHIGYEEVKVRQVGNGFTTYRFYGPNPWEINRGEIAVRNIFPSGPCSTSIPDFPEAPLPFDFKRGELKYVGQFNEAGNMLSSEDYISEFQESQIITPGIIPFMWMPYNGYGVTVTSTQYKLRSAKKIKVTKTVITSTATGATLTSTSVSKMDSKWHNNMTEQTTFNSLGEELKAKYVYTKDLVPLSIDTINTCMADYNNQVQAIMNNFNAAFYSCATNECRVQAMHAKVNNLIIARRAYVSCRRIRFTDQTNTFNTNLTNAKNAASAELKPIFDLSLRNENHLLETIQYKNTKYIGGLLWGYGYSTNTPVHIYANKAQKININSPSVSYTSLSVSGNNLIKDSRYSDESYVRIENGLLWQQTGKDSVTKSYLWGQYKNIPTAIVIGAAVSDIAYCSFELNETGNWTIVSPNRVSNDNVSGKQSYSLTNGTVSKTGLNTSKEYLLTFWFKSGTVPSINLTAGGVKVDLLKDKSKNGWSYKEYKISQTSTVQLQGSSIIDELRLYPVGSTMSTNSYDPLTGIVTQVDPNNVPIYYEYDELGRLLQTRNVDRQITSKFCYNLFGKPGFCDTNPVWVNTLTAVRCKQQSGSNTGEQEQEQKDVNPNSSTYNQLRWIVIGTNTTTCPITSSCNTGNCTGEGYKCVGNACEYGFKVVTNTEEIMPGMWECTYHYEYTDGTWSSNYYYYGSSQFECYTIN